jgi:large subunit ribosomal protein L22
MSKPKHPRGLADNEAQALVSNLRISPRKLNLVAGLIRNRNAAEAVATLTFSKRRIAQQVKKALESAIANAENNHQLDVDRLVVTRAEVGRSIVMRRFHARGRGRAARIEKWFSHLKIVVAEQVEMPAEEPETRTRRARAAVEAPQAAQAPVPAPAAAEASEPVAEGVA